MIDRAEGVSMLYYRLYYLDGDARIIDFEEFQADNDFQAITTAGNPKPGLSRELWNHDRRILELVA